MGSYLSQQTYQDIGGHRSKFLNHGRGQDAELTSGLAA